MALSLSIRVLNPEIFKNVCILQDEIVHLLDFFPQVLNFLAALMQTQIGRESLNIERRQWLLDSLPPNLWAGPWGSCCYSVNSLCPQSAGKQSHPPLPPPHPTPPRPQVQWSTRNICAQAVNCTSIFFGDLQTWAKGEYICETKYI